MTDPAQKKLHAIDVHIAGRLREARRERGISQTALGQAVGVTFQQIQRYEHGHNRISAATLYRLAYALDLPVDYFFEGLEPHRDAA